MREFASQVMSFESGFLTLYTASGGVCGVFDRFDMVASSTWMNLKRRCPPPVHPSPSLLHLAHDGCAVSHYTAWSTFESAVLCNLWTNLLLLFPTSVTSTS